MTDRTWTARVHRDTEGSAWLAEIVEEPRVHTYGRTIPAATDNIREALALWLEVEEGGDVEVDPASLNLEVEVEMPPEATEAVTTFLEVRELNAALDEVLRPVAAAAAQALSPIMSRRDAAAILGMSHQRVQQLVSESTVELVRSQAELIRRLNQAVNFDEVLAPYVSLQKSLSKIAVPELAMPPVVDFPKPVGPDVARKVAKGRRVVRVRMPQPSPRAGRTSTST